MTCRRRAVTSSSHGHVAPNVPAMAPSASTRPTALHRAGPGVLVGWNHSTLRSAISSPPRRGSKRKSCSNTIGPFFSSAALAASTNRVDASSGERTDNSGGEGDKIERRIGELLK
jgi:hypothetical protein